MIFIRNTNFKDSPKKPKENRLYNSPHQFEPLLPTGPGLEARLVKAHELQVQAREIKGRASSGVLASLAPLLRAMNSYYTNKIEGQETLPLEIERALRNEFSRDASIKSKQRLALAHMATERWAEETFGQQAWQTLFSAEVIAALHEHLFAQLPKSDRLLADGSVMQPGQWRTKEVKVHLHEAPAAKSVPAFLERFAQVYSQTRVGEPALVAVAAAHHRLAWIHPFADGNGRITRLHSHLLLYAMGLSNGIWSPLRGMARTQQRYYTTLSEADMHRHGDLDGRGNLSEKNAAAMGGLLFRPVHRPSAIYDQDAGHRQH